MRVILLAVSISIMSTILAIPVENDPSSRNGDTATAGDAGGILNTYGAPLINIDGRCLVPLPEGEGIGGHSLSGPKAACNVAPVDQYQAPQKLP